MLPNYRAHNNGLISVKNLSKKAARSYGYEVLLQLKLYMKVNITYHRVNKMFTLA